MGLLSPRGDVGGTLLHSHPHCVRLPSCSLSAPTLSVASLFNVSHSGGCKVVSGYDFKLQFLVTNEVAHRALFQSMCVCFESWGVVNRSLIGDAHVLFIP